MADLIFNPLIKKGFQEIADTESIETDVAQLKTNVADLQQHKITKCLIPADLLSIEEGEIIQWQGLTQTIDNVQFVKGYFYICNGETVTVQPPVNYLNFTNDFPLNHEYNLNDYNFTFGKYYKVKSLNINIANITEYSWTDLNGLYRFNSLEQIVLGTKIFDRQLNVFETVTSVDSVNYIATTDNNQKIKINGTSTSSYQTFWQTGNEDGSKTFYILEPNGYMYYLLVDWDFETNTIKAWFPFQCLRQTQNTPYNYNTEAFAQKNTQPPTPGITEENGILKVSFPVQFEKDVTVKGTQTVVHTEEIESENDYIELRADNPLGLASGEKSGIEVNNYDGNGTDCVLAVDKDGWARVGDEGGTLQKLATIEDSPTDGAFATYNATNKQLQTTKDGSDLNVIFTGTHKITKNIFSGNSLADMFTIIHGGLFTCQYTTDNIYNTIKSLIANNIRVGCISAQETTQAYLPAGNDEAYCVLFFKTDIGNTVPLLAIGYAVNKVFISHFNVTQPYTSFTWVQL